MSSTSNPSVQTLPTLVGARLSFPLSVSSKVPSLTFPFFFWTCDQFHFLPHGVPSASFSLFPKRRFNPGSIAQELSYLGISYLVISPSLSFPISKTNLQYCNLRVFFWVFIEITHRRYSVWYLEYSRHPKKCLLQKQMWSSPEFFEYVVPPAPPFPPTSTRLSPFLPRQHYFCSLNCINFLITLQEWEWGKQNMPTKSWKLLPFRDQKM